MSDKKYVVVDTEYGPVKGLQKESMLGLEYIGFQGIPYMQPPIGKLRFRDAEPHEKWTEPLDATREGPPFVHVDFFSFKPVGDLDALVLNIYTKDVDPRKPAPVMVFIHGGGFVGGSGGSDLCGPDFLMQKDVVLVSMNYRTGIFGFLSLDDESLGIPGNAGLKDQTFALKWIKNNIENFGGDPNNITIFGASAGGASVHYHLISELSRGLFHRAVSMSGTAFNKTWALSDHKKRGIPERLAKKIGWDGLGGEKGMLEFLESADPIQIVEPSVGLMTDEELYELNFFVPFGPVVEPYTTENCFIPKDPVLMARDAWGNDIDVIFTGGCNEGLLILFFDKRLGMDLEKYIPKFHQALPLELGVPYNSDKAKKYGEEVKKLYYGDAEPSLQNWQGFSYFYSDLHFWYGIYRSAISRAASKGKGKTYVYNFNVVLGLNFVKNMLKDHEITEATHGEDCFYLFKTMMSPPVKVPSKEFDVVKRMLNIYANFATDGTTTVENWELVEDPKAPFRVLNIGNEENTMILSPANERFTFWNEIYEKENCPIY